MGLLAILKSIASAAITAAPYDAVAGDIHDVHAVRHLSRLGTEHDSPRFQIFPLWLRRSICEPKAVTVLPARSLMEFILGRSKDSGKNRVQNDAKDDTGNARQYVVIHNSVSQNRDNGVNAPATLERAPWQGQPCSQANNVYTYAAFAAFLAVLDDQYATHSLSEN